MVSLEAARSHMGLLGALDGARYHGGVGPGVYDVHSPQVPSIDDIGELLRRAVAVVGVGRLWVNPDCGLKTRRYEEVVPALQHMTAAARQLRVELGGGSQPPAGGSEMASGGSQPAAGGPELPASAGEP